MADRVIIVGTKRGPEQVTAVELKQMAGRAGRKHDGGEGYVSVIACGLAECSRAEDIFEGEADLHVDSRMDSPHEAAFHIMAEIANGIVETRDDIGGWFHRSFAAHFGRSLNADEVVRLLKDEWEAIIEEDGRLKATALGFVGSQHYFHPSDVHAWRENFQEIFSRDIEMREPAIVWALANVPSEANRAGISVWKKQFLLQNIEEEMATYGLGMDMGNLQAAALWMRVLGGPSVGAAAAEIDRTKRDYERLHSVLLALNTIMSWERQDFFRDLRTRAMYGVCADLVPLCRLPGIGKTYALDLYNRGVRNLDDFEWVVGELESDCRNTKYLEAVKKVAASYLKA